MSGRPSRCNTRLDCDPWWASLTRGAVRSVSYGLVGRLTCPPPGIQMSAPPAARDGSAISEFLSSLYPLV
jgi:hypothetical protein